MAAGSSILQMAFVRRKTIKFIRLSQTGSNRAKAIISEKRGAVFIFYAEATCSG